MTDGESPAGAEQPRQVTRCGDAVVTEVSEEAEQARRVTR